MRDVWLHKARTSLAITAIAVGIVGAGAVLDTWSLVRTATRDEFRESNPASATLRVDSVDAPLLAAVRALPEIGDVQARHVVVGTARASSDAVSHTALLFTEADFDSIRIGTVVRERGAWPPPDSAVVLEKSSIGYVGADLGGALTLQVGSGPMRDVRIAGVARDVGLAPGWMDHVVYLFVPRATLASLGVATTMNELQIVVRDRSMDRDAVRRIAFKVRQLAEASGHTVHDVDVPIPGRHIHAAQIDSLLLTQGAFGALALFLSGFLVLNLVSAMLTGQVREIGVMKAIGASTAQIASMYLLFALMLGIIACAISIPIAAGIGRAYASFTADLLNFGIAGVSIPTRWIALQIVVGMLLPVVAAALPVMSGARMSVSRALRDVGIADDAAANGWLMRRLPWLNGPLLLSLRTAFRRRRRMALTLAMLATGGAVYLGAINLRASIVASMDVMFGGLRYDLSLGIAHPAAADSITSILMRIPGVARAEAWAGTRASVSHAAGVLGNTFPIAAPPAATTMLAPAIARGRWFQPSDDSARVIVVSSRLAMDEPGLSIDSAATLIIAGRPTTWRVIGIADAGAAPTAFAPREAIAALSANGLVDRATVRVRAGMTPADLRALVDDMRTRLSGAGLELGGTQLVAETRSAVEDHLLMVAGFLGIMGTLMIVVGGLGLAATMSLSVLERTREIGVLRAIGASHGAIISMIQIEGLVIAIASWLIAIPLSLPMSIILGGAFARVMTPVPITLVPNVAGVARWFAVVIAVSVVSCAWPALRATRSSAAKALLYE